MPAVGDDSAPVAPPAAVPPPLPPAPPARHSGPPEIESVAVKGTQRVRTIYLNGLYTLRLVLGPVWSAAGAFELTPGAKNPKNPITADLILGTRILGRRELVSVQRKNGGFHVENRSSEPIEARGLNGPIVIPPGTSLDAPDGTGLIVRGTPVILRSHRR